MHVSALIYLFIYLAVRNLPANYSKYLIAEKNIDIQNPLPKVCILYHILCILYNLTKKLLLILMSLPKQFQLKCNIFIRQT